MSSTDRKRRIDAEVASDGSVEPVLDPDIDVVLGEEVFLKPSARPRGVVDRRARSKKDSAALATSASTGLDPGDAKPMSYPSGATSNAIAKSEMPGSVTGASGDQTSSRNSSPPSSKNSGRRSTTSKRRWRKPTNAREFAAQCNAIATAILNDEIEIETAKSFSAVARTAAQLITAEVQRARWLGQVPDLDFDAFSVEADAYE